MTGSTIESLIAELHDQALADPQIPRSSPTTSFWQLPPHPTLSTTQSKQLPSTTDYAIIGSGITGCSIAKNLLDLSSSVSSAEAASPSAFSVTVFEARTLTSGATGRNGGALTSFVPGDYAMLSERFGHETAVKIARFANRTLEKMHELGNSSPQLKEAGEVRRTMDVIAFQDKESFLAAQESIRLYAEHVPEERGKAEVLNAQELDSRYNMRGVGAILFNNGAFWPYRLITGIWAQLLEQYQSRLLLETNTPVTQITYDPATSPKHPYVLQTPRGSVRASEIIHATNGYAGHLLPELRGKIFPVRGTMSTQKAPKDFGLHGNKLSWSVVHSGRFDETSQLMDVGLYYANQNPISGDIFIGGEEAKVNELIVSDDSEVRPPCRQNISTVLPRYFTKGWKDGQEPEVRQVWSGIMGFTADRLPLVGPLPESITRRGKGRGGGEWLAAGFNGYGMPLCWSCGEAVAKMLLGIDVGDFLPDVFLATEERLNDVERMSTATALQMLFGGHP